MSHLDDRQEPKVYPKIFSALDALTHDARHVADKAEQSRQETEKAIKEKERMMLEICNAKIIEIMECRRKGLKFKFTNNLGNPSYRIKFIIRGQFLDKNAAVAAVKHMVETKLVDYTKKNVFFVNVEDRRNWWRGGPPNFYDDATEEDFNCCVLCGLPLISRSIAWVYDRLNPCTKITVDFWVAK